MWVPTSEEQLAALVSSGDLVETDNLDLKRGLPSSPKKNSDIAVDVAAMTTDGGVLIYGVGPPNGGGPLKLYPIDDVDKAEERLVAIARSSIGGDPDFRTRIIPAIGTEGTGYLIVEIPLSPNAPHQVLASGLFYGRRGTANVKLSQGEIDRLYARRLQFDINLDQMLYEGLGRIPPGLRELDFGHLHVIARPSLTDETLLDRALAAKHDADHPNDTTKLLAYLRQATRWSQGILSPSIRDSVQFRLTSRGQEASFPMRFDMASEEHARGAYLLEVAHDGGVYAFNGRVAARPGADKVFRLFDRALASEAITAVAFAGEILHAGGYRGPVAVGMAVDNILDAADGNGGFIGFTFDRPRYMRADTFDAAKVASDPVGITRVLLGRLFDALTQGWRDPVDECLVPG